MTLVFQMAEHKRKSQAINDFVIEATYVKDLAAQVFYADGKTLQSEAFQGACESLRDLCETLQGSVTRLQGLIPLSPVPSPGERRETAQEACLDDPSFPLLTPPLT